ncbi:MAG: sugar phosphate isomerase/epimerase [Verrucomicrobia bacterium]|nr:sugar phosphate isomerase/epimerase [Verrucomicrobiota bacterium]
MNEINRRQFIHAALATTGVWLTQTGCVSTSRSAARKRIAFNTANLVARFTNYRFELKHWGEQHQKTVALTDEAAWTAICRDIAAVGFSAVEIWEAHAAPESLNRDQAASWKRILADHGLRPIAYAGSLRRETLQICQWLGIPHIDGGLRGQTPEQATALCQEFGIGFNIENHPEKTAAEALAKVGGGNDWLGLCVDTGWFGTQAANVPEQIRAAGKFARHTHIKDVKAAGAHETCLLGEGIVNVAGGLTALRDIGYTGWYSWEDEPEDRNPFDSAVRNREWLETRL